MRTEGEFRALLVLLSDEAERVASVAWETLLAEREAAVPYLEEAALSPDPRLRGRARLVLADLRLGALEQQWRAYTALPDDDMDLEPGCLLLSHLTSGDVNDAAVRSFLDATAGLVRAHMVNVGGLQALNEVLFENLGFRGGDFEQPECHYLNSVLERRAGIPISLAAVYVLVGLRAGLPVSGVAMPGHYLTRYDGPEGPVFVDCYNRGRMYQPETLANVLANRGLTRTQQYLAPSSNRFTLFRMMNNLEQLYQQAEDLRMVRTIRRFRAQLRPEA
jgi:regulator of sirC expression with transglutaminase-like and TPR domain